MALQRPLAEGWTVVPIPGYPPQQILIVDDEATVADSLQLILSGRGYDVRAVYSAEQAIEVLADWPPKLAIIDVMLPRMNGIEFAKVLKANYQVPGTADVGPPRHERSVE